MVAPFGLKDRVAAVTGACGQLGPVWCAALLEAGANVLALDLKGVKGDGEFVRVATSKHLLRVDADVRDIESIRKAAAAGRAELGEVDILVNNAGIDQPPTSKARGHRIEDIPADIVRQVFDVNVVGLFQCAQVFGAAMVKRGRGSIVNIGSLYAEVSPDARYYDHIKSDPPFLKPPAYGASKAAVVSLTKYLATHWGPSGVRVNALSPGGVKGGQDAEFLRKYGARVPMGRMAEKGDLAGPLLFLASDASSYVTGINLVVDGGYTAW